MHISSFKDFKNVLDERLPIEFKIHIFESDLSELLYRLWCRMTGGRFERNQINQQNSCILVTKRGFHLISTLIGRLRSHGISESVLEAYQRNCPGPKPPAINRTMYYYWWIKYFSSEKLHCRDCRKPYEVQEDDRKIVGKSK